VWGEFRVARRAKILSADIQQDGQTVDFSGSYKGFHALPGQATHQRGLKIELAADQTIASIQVEDEIQFKGNQRAESFVHFHPELKVEDRQNGNILLELAGTPVAELTIPNEQAYHFEEGWYCPEFGQKINNKRLVMSAKGHSPLRFVYKIRKL
jgi:hypothetical protein